MPKSYQYMANYDAETTAYSTAVGPGGSSPYAPTINGRLTGVRIIVGRTAATTLTNEVNIRLSCPLWTPNSMVLSACGTGLQTAPAFNAQTFDYDVDQPVSMSSPITVEGINILANAVTNDIHVLGRFETGG